MLRASDSVVLMILCIVVAEDIPLVVLDKNRCLLKEMKIVTLGFLYYFYKFIIIWSKCGHIYNVI